MIEVDLTRPREGVVLVEARGELDFVTGARLSSALAEATAGAPDIVLVDLAGLEFIDSSGVKILLAAARTLRAEGGRLILAAPTLPVRRALEILRVGDTLPIVADRRDALDPEADAVVECEGES